MTTMKEYKEAIDKCIINVCKNHNIPTGIQFTEVKVDYGQMVFITFMHATVSTAFCKSEIMQDLEKNGIRTKAGYRHIKRLVESRLANSAMSLKHLAEETLKNLGY